ncbi:DUF6497 family protein [Roseobacteraceae bacterium NS-SX3]
MIRASRIWTARATGAAPAAPAGGARFGGRGCGYATGVFLFAFTVAQPLAAGGITVPSGQPVALSEVLLDENPGELWARFRFVAPAIAGRDGSAAFEQAGADMDHLCATLALAYLREHEIAPARVVISLSDRALPFGAADPAATQFFEAYRPEADACIWEGF